MPKTEKTKKVVTKSKKTTVQKANNKKTQVIEKKTQVIEKAHQDPSLWQYFSLCVTKKYAAFEGRSRRKEYFAFILFNFIISFVIGFIGGLTGADISTMSGIVSLLLFLPGLGVLVRRLHDTNYSGIWAVIPYICLLFLYFLEGEVFKMMFIPFGLICFIAGAVCLIRIFFKSDAEPNQYGPVPEGVVFDK